MGLNVKMPEEAALAIDQQWTDIETLSEGAHPGRNALLAALINELVPLAASFSVKGFSAWRSDWQLLDAYDGKSVILQAGSKKLAGIARGVDERGALLLETEQGEQVIYGGEITLRSGH